MRYGICIRETNTELGVGLKDADCRVYSSDGVDSWSEQKIPYPCKCTTYIVAWLSSLDTSSITLSRLHIRCNRVVNGILHFNCISTSCSRHRDMHLNHDWSSLTGMQALSPVCNNNAKSTLHSAFWFWSSPPFTDHCNLLPCKEPIVSCRIQINK